MNRQRLRLMVAAGLLTTAFVMQGNRAHAQTGNVGIGTSSPDASAKLDVSATDKGVLFPRVALTASNAAGPVTSPATGLMVYNTATTTTGTNDVSPGIYIWTGSAWAKVNTSTATGNDKNIYEGNGTLTGNRVVTQAGNSLSFTGGNVNIKSQNVDGSLQFDNGDQGRNPRVIGVNDTLELQSGANAFQLNLLPNGNIGLGTSSANGKLQFSNSAANRKIVFYETANNDHQFNGIGLNSNVQRYQTEGPNTDHVFFSAASATSSNELMRVKGNGNVTVGAYNNQLSPATSRMVSVQGNSGSYAGYRMGTFGDGYGSAIVHDDRNTAGNEIGLHFKTGYAGADVVTTASKMFISPSGNVGIGTTTPGSTLQVNGSFAGNYNTQTGNYTLAANDFYVVYNGSATGTFTLPASATTTKGRLYSIKNTTAAQTLNINAGSGENIDGAATIAVSPGNSVQLVNTGGAAGSGTTWEVVNFAATTTSTGTTIYTGNGTLTGNRTITEGANYLQLSSSGGTYPLYVDGNVNGLTRTVFRNLNTGAASRVDLQMQTANGTTGEGLFLGVENGTTIFGTGIKSYLDNRSSGRMVFGTNGNEQLTLATGGNVGIGLSTPNAPLQFANTTVNRKIVTWEVANNDHQFYGIGVNPSIFRFQVPDVNTDYTYYAGTSASTSDELIRIKGNGNVGIGTSTPFSKLAITATNTTALTLQQSNASFPGVNLQMIANKAAPGSFGALADGDRIGSFNFSASNGTNYQGNAGMEVYAVGAQNSTNAGSRMTFYTVQQGEQVIRNRMIIADNGNVGIGTGTTAPSAALQVNGAIEAYNGNSATRTGNFYDGTANKSGVQLYTDANDAYLAVQRRNYGFINAVAHFSRPASPAPVPLNDNFIQFAVGGSSVGGVILNTSSSVAYQTTSDIRLKTNIRNTGFGLKDLMKIEVKDYVYKTDLNIPQTGFIAQQLYTVYPTAVVPGGEDAGKNPWTVDYSRVTPLIVKAVQDLKAEVDALKAENARLTAAAATAEAAAAKAEASDKQLAQLAAQVKEMQQMLGVNPRHAGTKVGRR